MPMPLRPTLLASLVALAALAAMPSASATCVTVGGDGVCATLGGSGTGPGVVGTGGLVCVDAYCPTLGSVPYDCLVKLGGAGNIWLSACIGTPPLL
ncbi:MAG TPA: hypothetical protein VM241_06020 [Candidatus Thermoplasmatota archaeon]|nr:hypothetical protein [Candidatus Thermoplasmatota archaeon]